MKIVRRAFLPVALLGLLLTACVGYYQEEGGTAQIIRKGSVKPGGGAYRKRRKSKQVISMRYKLMNKSRLLTEARFFYNIFQEMPMPSV